MGQTLMGGVITMFQWLRMTMNSGSVFGFFLQAVPAACAAGIVYVIVIALAIKKNKTKVNWAKETMQLLFTCYLTGLISLVILPAYFWLNIFDGIFLGWWDQMSPIFSLGEFNFVPSLILVLSGEQMIGSWVKTMLIGNVAMFLPLGFFLPFVTERVDRKNIFAAAAVIPLIAELLQTIFGRSFDVDDLICNFIGIVLGFFIGLTVKNGQRRSAA